MRHPRENWSKRSTRELAPGETESSPHRGRWLKSPSSTNGGGSCRRSRSRSDMVYVQLGARQIEQMNCNNMDVCLKLDWRVWDILVNADGYTFPIRKYAK